MAEGPWSSSKATCVAKPFHLQTLTMGLNVVTVIPWMSNINISPLAVGIADFIKWSKVGVSFTPDLVAYGIRDLVYKVESLATKYQGTSRYFQKRSVAMKTNLFSSDRMHHDIKIVIEGKNSLINWAEDWIADISNNSTGSWINLYPKWQQVLLAWMLEAWSIVHIHQCL